MQKYEGSMYFRQRLVCSILSGKPVQIDRIREMDTNPGLRDYEANLLRLIEKITKGSTIEINETGTRLRFRPGVISGGSYIEHDCGLTRGMGYFLEVLVCLAPFGKKPLSITLRGITNNEKDLSVDTFRNVTLNLLSHFGIEGKENDTLKLVVKSRGAPPLGGGEVVFMCPIVKQLRPIQLLDEGMIKRIRGIAYTTRVNPENGLRMATSARALLNKFIPDVYIFTDTYKGKKSGASPGYALFLMAESDVNDIRISAESCATSAGTAASNQTLSASATNNAASQQQQQQQLTPEDVGRAASILLAEEIKNGGCVDSAHQWLMFLFMALTPEDVSKIRVGKLSEYGINYMRHIKDFFGVTFKLVPEYETQTVVCSCLGSGFKNLAKKSA